MQYSKKVIVGFCWQSALKLGLAGFSLVKIFFLARLLQPSDFGVFALVAVALGVSEAVTQTGINITILQTQQDPKRLVNTAWMIAIVRGLVIAIILSGIGLLMSWFFNNQDLTKLALLASLVPIIKGFINPSIAIWQKEFLFKIDALFYISRQAIEVASTVVLALIWPNVAVFIWGMIIAALCEVILSFVMANPKPKMIFDQAAAKTIFQNAKGLSITAALSYLTENLDDLILGKTLGTYQLGLYHNGYAISHKLTYEPAKAANYSLMSAYTKLAKNPIRLWSGFIKAAGIIAVSLSLITLAVSYLKTPIIMVALGPTWLEVIPILPWLAIAGLGQALVAFIYTYLIAKQNYILVNRHLIATVSLMSFALFFASKNSGLVSAVAALALTRWALLIPLVFLTYVNKNTSYEAHH